MGTSKCLLLFLLLSYTSTMAQSSEMAPVFQQEKALHIRFEVSFETLKKSKKDSVYFPTLLSYQNDDGQWDTVHATVRARGNFRRKNCFIPPMRFKIAKADRGDKVFAGVKNLKLVLPCNMTKNCGDLIMKEFVCYQLYEPLTPYVFGTRLVDITLVETSGKSKKTYELKGFFIEDDDEVAKRFQAKVVALDNLHPMLLQDTCALRMDLFQYMIGNTDFSTTFFHNAKIIKTKAGRFIPIAYDFDMSGLVNAPYATFDENLNISDVRQRVYRGFCRDDHVAQYVRSEYITLESKIFEVVDRYKYALDAREFNYVKNYLNDFFETIKSDGAFRQKISAPCRTR